jgi:hypothetical protein
MFWRAYSHGSASMAALAGGEIGANRQVCPTIVDGNVKLHPAANNSQFPLASGSFVATVVLQFHPPPAAVFPFQPERPF